MAKRYLSDVKVGERYGVNRVTPWRWANDPRYAHLKFPRPEKVGPNTTRWDDGKLDAWDEWRTATLAERDDLTAAEQYDAEAREAEAAGESEAEPEEEDEEI